MLNEAQLALLLKSAEGTRLVAPAYLAIVTGVRRGELVALRWVDLDAEAGTISVRRSIEQTSSGITTKTPKSGKSRSISLAAGTLEVLRKHRIAQSAERLKAGAASNLPARRRLNLGARVLRKGVLRRRERRRYRPRETARPASRLRLSYAQERSSRKGRIRASWPFDDLDYLDLYSHILPGLQEAAAAKLDDALLIAFGKAGR